MCTAAFTSSGVACPTLQHEGGLDSQDKHLGASASAASGCRAPIVSCQICPTLQDEGDLDSQRNCPVHRRPCEQRSEENYFFRLSRYQQQIEVCAQAYMTGPSIRRI